MKVIGTIVRWFTLGIIAGLLLAPRAGEKTRALIAEKFTNLVDGDASPDAAMHKQAYATGGDAPDVQRIAL